MAGIPRAANDPALFRLGALLTLASVPAWIAASTRTSARLTEDQLIDAHQAGYQECLAQLGAAAGSCAPRREVGTGVKERHGR
ncbi:hypothetical protein [Streptomyces sp. NPDC020983]|uniref:hypothetical protein n=1 Tax=Streptomyces sp. NPDC020983 TaxID=3365106 RepID=UPI0037AD965F